MAFDLRTVSQEQAASVIDLLKMTGQRSSRVTRDVTTSLGIKNYDLQRPEKVTKAWWFPLSRMTPNVPGDGDTATHWIRVTGVNTAIVEGGVPEGQRSILSTTTTDTDSASYISLGLEDAVTFEARDAAQGFTDLRARTGMRLMLSVQEQKERMIYGGNGTLIALGTPTLGSPADVATGGNFAYNTEYYVVVVALTPQGLRYAQAKGIGAGSGVPIPATVTGPDGFTYTVGYGASQPSSAGNVTTANDSNNTHAITCTVTQIPGAAGYAWYVGLNDTTTCYLNAITTINSVKITNKVTTGQHVDQVTASDNSKNPYVSDGLLSYAFTYGQVTAMATGTAGTGTGLTADGAGGIVEINTMLQDLWDNTRVSPQFMVMSSQEINNVYTKSLSGGSAPIFRFNIDAGDTAPLTLGRVVGSYLNRFTVDGGNLVQVILHPDAVKGTILFGASMVPGQLFPSSELGQLFEWHQPEGGQIAQTEWPLRTRKYETGIYERGVLAHYFPATLGVITNVGNL
jgi:hypothetical protein